MEGEEAQGMWSPFCTRETHYTDGQAPFSWALFWSLHDITYLHFNVQVWTQEKILSSYHHDAMILNLPAKVA